MIQIDDELREFIESGVYTAVGTADPEGRPHVTIGWGARVRESRHEVVLFLDAPRAGPILADIRATGRIAFNCTSPVSYRSIQFKGRCTAVSEATEAELAWVRRHREAFLSETSLVGDPPQVIRNVWMEGAMVRLDISVEQAFDQTPGLKAGRPL